jgi:hypothetical protein
MAHFLTQVLPRRFNHRQGSRGGLLLGLLLMLSSCEAPPPVPGSDQTPDVAATTFASPNPNFSGTEATVSVEIYSIDSTCETLVPSEITVPADRSLEASITSLLTRASPDGLSPLNYSIEVDSTTGKATLDLRPTVSGDPPRSLRSLSSCEQLALFGSLRETLLSGPAWGIQSVEFTENGEPLVL